MKKQTFFQKLGFGKPQRGRPAKERHYKIYTGDLTKIGGLVKTRKPKVYPYTKREKKISLATVSGAGAGFVIGGFTGGLGGILLGVPIGTLAGNVFARKRYPQRGRKVYYKQSLFKQLTTPREELMKEREDVNRLERARMRSIRSRPLYAKGRK